MKRLLSFLLALLTLTLGVHVCTAAADEVSAEGATIVNLGIPMQDRIPNTSEHLYARTVWDIASYDGRIYIGAGDYDKNTGNALGGIPVYSYDPATGSWKKEYTASDEQPSRFFTEWGNLYIPGTDPVAGSLGEIHCLSDGTWSKNSEVLYGTHMFDMLFMSDSLTVFAALGTDYRVPPTVMLSEDGGERFKSVSFRKDGVRITRNNLNVTSNPDKGDIYCRVYNMFEYRGQVYATVWANNSEVHAAYSGLYRFNRDERIFDYYGPTTSYLIRNSMSQSYDLTFNDRFVVAYNTLTVFSEDLTSWEQLSGFTGQVTCARQIGEELYFTTYQQKSNVVTDGYITRLYRTSDLENIELVTSFEYGSYVRSFCYDNGVFYMGTESSRSQPTTATGTVFALTLQRAECQHENIHTAFRSPGEGTTPGNYSESCPDCGLVNFSTRFPFGDLENRWYLPGVMRAYSNGLMNGTGEKVFNPGGTTTRAQLVTVLYKLENSPSVEGISTPFTDVDEGRYYTDPIAWAYKRGIVTGVSDTSFNPTGSITREQFATILYRYAEKKGVNVSARADLSTFTDEGSISSYAKEALSWANSQGYITGTSATVINPKGSATRAQMATILVRYMNATE